jgi:hypothetical protein
MLSPEAVLSHPNPDPNDGTNELPQPGTCARYLDESSVQRRKPQLPSLTVLRSDAGDLRTDAALAPCSAYRIHSIWNTPSAAPPTTGPTRQLDCHAKEKGRSRRKNATEDENTSMAWSGNNSTATVQTYILHCLNWNRPAHETEHSSAVTYDLDLYGWNPTSFCCASSSDSTLSAGNS